MVGGAYEALRARPGGIAILAEATATGTRPFCIDASYINLWTDWRPVFKVLEALPADANLYILGADILDGHYSYVDAARRIRLARLASAVGIPSRIVGFSLNDSPAPEVVQEFRQLPGDVPLYLRDPISLERANRLGLPNVQQSADVAFLLRAAPGSQYETVRTFASAQRQQGRAVFGVNVHELFSKAGEGALERLCSSIAALMASMTDCAFVLIPHDFRSYVDDRRPLRQVMAALPREAVDRALLLDSPMRAAEIKQICGAVDGVVTGRMHLAIAALGMQTPVLGIVYQGKFEGTFSYFGLEGSVMTPQEAGEPSIIVERFRNWRAHLDENRSQIVKSLSNVNELALKNFA